MTAVNQLQTIERLMSPEDVTALRRLYPTLLEALKAQGVVISQLIVRAGGSGTGGSVINLDGITEDVNELETWTAEIAARSRRPVVNNDAENAIQNTMHLSRLIAEVRTLTQKVNDLEAICLSTLAGP